MSDLSDSFAEDKDIQLAAANKEIARLQKLINRYDTSDFVQREGLISAGPLKVAAYRVRDPESLEWSPLQFHMTYDNMVMGVMGEEAAKLFAHFVDDTLGTNAEWFENTTKAWANMNSEQARAKLVALGILNEDGTLHENYK